MRRHKVSINLKSLRAKYHTTTTLAKKANPDLRIQKFIARCESQIDFAEQMKNGVLRPVDKDGNTVHPSVIGFGLDTTGAYGAKIKYGPKTLDPFGNNGQPQKCADLDAVMEFYQDFIDLAKSNPTAVAELIASTGS